MKKTLIQLVLAGALIAGSGPAMAQSKKARECALQGALVGAVQQARLGGVAKRNVRASVAASNPELSEAVLDTVPQLADHIYGMRKRDLRKVDMRTVTEEQCVASWDQIQAMRKNLSN